VLAVGCVVGWLWRSDRLPAAATVQVGEAVRLPLGAHTVFSHSWWATVILLLVDATVFASMVFAHVHVAMLLDICPPPGGRLPPLRELLLATAGFAASAAVFQACGRGLRERALRPLRLLPLALSAALLAGAFAASLQALGGLSPTANAWSATIAAVAGYTGFHAVLLLVCAVYLGARIGSGLVTPRQRATYDNIALLWWGGCVQGVLAAWMPHAVAAWMP
jgi:cytochrome c oxidase subunit I+III